MGNKQSGRKPQAKSSLHRDDHKRLTQFLEQNKGSPKFTYQEIQRLWNDFLVPDLLHSYANVLMQSNNVQKEHIGIEDFVSLYVKTVRGSSNEKVKTVARIIGSQKNNHGVEVLSYQSIIKYLSDLMESYFIVLETRNNECYKSWTRTRKPQRTIIEEIMGGVCNDLKRTNDEVTLEWFEPWLNECGLVNLLHSEVLGSLYNLHPEHDLNIVPLAEFPSSKAQPRFPALLDLSQVVYLNSFLPSQDRETWRFLFSIDTHGESFAKFVASIINQGSIILIINTSDNDTFGGFISMNMTLSPKWIGSDDCFLFKLDSTVDVYPATGYNDHYAYVNMGQATLPNGLGMGGQYHYWGLWIDSQFGIGECSESCTTYKNYKMLASQKKFHIKRMEVWGVSEPPPTEEELGERRSTKSGKSSLDQDPTSTQILEMAGREMHSKHLRKGSMK